MACKIIAVGFERYEEETVTIKEAGTVVCHFMATEGVTVVKVFRETECLLDIACRTQSDGEWIHIQTSELVDPASDF